MTRQLVWTDTEKPTAKALEASWAKACAEYGFEHVAEQTCHEVLERFLALAAPPSTPASLPSEEELARATYENHHDHCGCAWENADDLIKDRYRVQAAKTLPIILALLNRGR